MENEWTKEIDRLKRELEETQAELAEARKAFLEVQEFLNKLVRHIEGLS